MIRAAAAALIAGLLRAQPAPQSPSPRRSAKAKEQATLSAAIAPFSGPFPAG